MFPWKILEYNNERCFQSGPSLDVIRETTEARVGRCKGVCEEKD
jgi:hypothetical protein